MKSYVISTIFTLALLPSMAALAEGTKAKCMLEIDRTPCKGKETEVYKPYAGKNPTQEPREKAASAEDCLKEGEKAAKIVRKGLIEKKHVKVTFDGKEAGIKEDKSTCK